jgi:hypothetical protein
VGFFGLLRLGELMQRATSSLRSTSKISWRHDVHLEAAFFSFCIPQSKTDVIFEEDQVVIQRAPLHLIHLRCLSGILCLVPRCSHCFLTYGFALMVLFPLTPQYDLALPELQKL